MCQTFTVDYQNHFSYEPVSIKNSSPWNVQFQKTNVPTPLPQRFVRKRSQFEIFGNYQVFWKMVFQVYYVLFIACFFCPILIGKRHYLSKCCGNYFQRSPVRRNDFDISDEEDNEIVENVTPFEVD